MVAAEVVKAGGPSDWALPYWNYSAPNPPSAQNLPAAFRNPTLPGGAPNPLFVAQRDPAANSGGMAGVVGDADVTTALNDHAFSNPAGNFGGPATLFSHGGGPVGSLEDIPHGSMHVAVGGASALLT